MTGYLHVKQALLIPTYKTEKRLYTADSFRSQATTKQKQQAYPPKGY